MGIFTDLCVLSHRKDCLGVSEGPKEGQVICTYTSSVEICNAQDHSLESTWPLGSADRVTCAAVHHAPTSTYYAVCNKTELVYWAPPETGTVRKELNSTVHSIHAPRRLPYMVIVYSDGTVGTQAGDQSVKVVDSKTRHASSTPVVQAALLSDVGGCEAVVLLCTQGKQQGMLCVCTLGRAGPEAMTKHQLPDTKVSQMCICGQSVIILDSLGTVHMFALGVASPRLEVMVTVELLQREQLLVSIDTCHFVVADGKSMSIWETTYGTCQGRLEPGYTNITGLYSSGGVLYMVCDDGLAICSVHCPPGGIASALGKKEVKGVANDCLLVAPAWLLPKQDIAMWGEEVSKESQEVAKWLRALLDPAETPSLESFSAQVDLRPLPPGPAFEAVVRRILEEERFWGRDVLKRCLTMFSFPVGMLKRLVERCLENKDWPLLVTTLECAEGGIPEDMIVKLLEVIINLPIKVKACNEKVRQNKLLALVLTQPHNDAAITGPLSAMPLPAVMSLLLFLSKRIKMEYLIGSTPTGSTPLPYETVVDWIGLLLDTHFTQLMLTEESKQLLSRLNRSVNRQVTFLSGLSVLHGVKHAAANGAVVKMDDWLYKVDTLEIRI